MNRGFYTIMAAQFFSSLADNALLFVAISLLTSMNAPASLTPLLKLSFVLFYVLLSYAAASGPSWLVAASFQTTVVAGMLCAPLLYNDARARIPRAALAVGVLIIAMTASAWVLGGRMLRLAIPPMLSTTVVVCASAKTPW